jgi:magnesium chelatase family protein
MAGPVPESSSAVAARIVSARGVAVRRNGGGANASLVGRTLLDACDLDSTGRRTMSELADGLELTARGVHRTLRVARTVADLQGGHSVTAEDIFAAASLRDRSMEVELVA